MVLMGESVGFPVAVDHIARFGVSVTLERRNTNSDDTAQADAEWGGDASLYHNPETITAIYDPVYSDLGRDSPERRTGTVSTYESVKLGDKITGPDQTEGQEITQVIPRYHKNGTFHYNEVSL